MRANIKAKYDAVKKGKVPLPKLIQLALDGLVCLDLLEDLRDEAGKLLDTVEAHLVKPPDAESKPS